MPFSVCGDQELLAVRREVVAGDADERVGRHSDQVGSVGSRDVHDTRARVAVGHSFEGNSGAVARPSGTHVCLGALDDRRRVARRRVCRVDIAGAGICHETVPGEAERRRDGVPRADHQGETRGDEQEDQRQDRDRTPRHLPGERGLTRDVNHREPPFEEGPGGPLARASGQPEEVVEVVGRPRLRDLIEDRGEPPVEAIARHHAAALPGSTTPRASRPRRPPSASRGAIDAGETWPFPAGCRACSPPRVAACPGSNACTTTARHSGSRCRSASSTRSRSAIADVKSTPVGPSIGVNSTSIARCRRRRMMSMQEWTTSRRSQASNRSGSRSAGRVRQARMNPSWTPSRASSGSLRISRAAASSRATASPASVAKAS